MKLTNYRKKNVKMKLERQIKNELKDSLWKQ